MQVFSPSLNNRAKDWIGIWAPSVLQPVLGRVLVKNQFTQMATIQHWIFNSILSTTDRPIIQPCTGCVINESVSPNVCSFVAPVALSVLLGRTTKVDSSTRQLYIPLFELFQIISYHYNFSTNNLPFVISTFMPISLPNNLLLRFIERGQLCNELLQLQTQLSNSSLLDFYTDGSVTDIGTEQASMAFALLQTNSSSPFVQFKANIEQWCSSNCAELAAILLALLISPSNSTINIFPDCKSVIDYYTTLISRSFISPRSIFKGSTNNLLWSMIMDTITINSLNITFHKIKAHSGDYYNDLVDNLARTLHSYNSLSISFLPSNISTLRYFPLWNNIIIEPNL